MSEIHENQPKPGWYAYRKHRSHKWEPAFIDRRGGSLVCRIGDNMVDPFEYWTWLAGNERKAEDVKFRFREGRWPDEPEAIKLSNLPADPFEALQAEIEAKTEQYKELVHKHPEAKSQEQCNLFRNLETEFQGFLSRADKMHKAEKEPHFLAGKAVDDKYRFRNTLDDIKRHLRRIYGAFMAAEEKRLQAEADAKYRAEVDRIAAERAQQKEDDPVAFFTSPAPELPLGPEPVKVQAGGLFERKAGLKDEWVTEVTDYAKAAKHFKDHPDLMAVVDRLAKHAAKDAKGAIKIPGVKITLARVPA